MIPVELRTQPLVDINAYFVYPGQKVKHFVLPAWKIAHCTFDQLGPVWTAGIEWFAAPPKDAADARKRLSASLDVGTTVA